LAKVTNEVTRKRCREDPAMRQDSEKPWYRKVKDCWYAWVGGRQISLGVKGRASKRAALEAFFRLMADAKHDRLQPTLAASADKSEAISVQKLAEAFLLDAQRRVKPETMAVWRSALNRLANKFGVREARSIKPYEVEQFAAKPGLSDSTINSILSSIVTAYRWAVRAGILESNPLTSVRKPPMRSRGAEAVLSDDQFRRLCSVASASFKPFLMGLWLTGCRPGELSRLEVKDVDFANGVAVLAEHKTSGKTGRPRVIFLSPEALSLFRMQVDKNPEGLLFRNKLGRGFNRYTLFKAMEAARNKAGIPNAICYSTRHSFATQALANGIPDATVAALLGHASTTMLHKHYSHLTSRADVLRAAVAKVRGEGENHGI
jgi:integrase